jgi:hypothetical protein
VVLPIIIFHSLRIRCSAATKLLHVCIFLFGIGVILFGTKSVLEDMAADYVPEPGIAFRAGISAECRALYDAAITKEV